MSKFTIVPAHDPRVMVEIEIPQPGRKKSLHFTAARLDFQPAHLVEQYAADYARLQLWIEDQAAIAEGRRDDEHEPLERPTVNGAEFDHPLTWWAHALEMPDAEAIAELTAGESAQVWSIWQRESETDLGESFASGDR